MPFRGVKDRSILEIMTITISSTHIHSGASHSSQNHPTSVTIAVGSPGHWEGLDSLHR